MHNDYQDIAGAEGHNQNQIRPLTGTSGFVCPSTMSFDEHTECVGTPQPENDNHNPPNFLNLDHDLLCSQLASLCSFFNLNLPLDPFTWPESLAAIVARVKVELTPFEDQIAELQKLKEQSLKQNALIEKLKEQNAEQNELIKKLKEQKAEQKTKLAETEKTLGKTEKTLAKAEKTIEEQKVKLGLPPANDSNSSMPGSKVVGGRRKGKGKGNKNKNDQDDNDQPKTDNPKDEKRKRGGQKKRKPKNFKPFPPEKVTESTPHEPPSNVCSKCGGEMDRDSELDTLYQQVELLNNQIKVVEDRAAAYTCPHCQNVKKGSVPEEIRKRGLFGPNFIVFMVMLRFVCNASFRKIQNFLEFTLRVKASLGCITETILKASNCLVGAYEEIMAHIPTSLVVYADETTHRDNGRHLYTWVFVTSKAILFSINNRSRDILDKILTNNFVGTLCSDYYCVYLSFVKSAETIKHQTCLAHLAREFKRCAEYIVDLDISQYGEKMLKLLRALFDARDEFNAEKTEENLEKLLSCAKEFNKEGAIGPDKGIPRKLAKRFSNSDSYTTFVNNPEVEATNNTAERAIRKIVVQRHVTQGTRGEKGMAASERYWSVKATCELQNKPFQEYFKACYEAHSKGQPTPSIFAE